MADCCSNDIIDEKTMRELDKGFISLVVDGYEAYICEPNGKIRFISQAELDEILWQLTDQ